MYRSTVFHAPVVFAKKTQSINLEGEMYVAEVESFTHKCKNQVIVAQKFLNEDDHVLILDDFLANGCALQGLIQIVQSSGATIEGIGITIEKGFRQADVSFEISDTSWSRWQSLKVWIARREQSR